MWFLLYVLTFKTNLSHVWHCFSPGSPAASNKGYHSVPQSNSDRPLSPQMISMSKLQDQITQNKLLCFPATYTSKLLHHPTTFFFFSRHSGKHSPFSHTSFQSTSALPVVCCAQPTSFTRPSPHTTPFVLQDVEISPTARNPAVFKYPVCKSIFWSDTLCINPDFTTQLCDLNLSVPQFSHLQNVNNKRTHLWTFEG